MRAKSGGWRVFFLIFLITGFWTIGQSAWAATFTAEAENQIANIESIDQGQDISELIGRLDQAQYVQDVEGTLEFIYNTPDELPEWLLIHENTGQLMGTPQNKDVGQWTNITIYVRDFVSESNFTSDSIGPFTIEVVDRNDFPIIQGDPPLSALQDEEYYFQPSAEDKDGDDLTFSITTNGEAGAPGWATFKRTTGELSGIPENQHVGTYPITITVSDGRDDPAIPDTYDRNDKTFTVEVVNKNDPPEIEPDANAPTTIDQAYVDVDETSEPDTVLEGAAYTYVLDATDIDQAILPEGEHVLTFQEPVLPDWLVYIETPAPYGSIVNKANRPNNSDVRQDPYTFNLTVEDNHPTNPLSGTHTVSVTVNNVNDRPKISGTPQPAIFQSTESNPTQYSFTPRSSDPDEDTLSFSAKFTNDDAQEVVYPAEGWPNWLKFDPKTGALSGEPTNDDVGTVSDIVITVSDSELTSTLGPFSIEVINVNDPPILELYFKGSLIEGDTITAKQHEDFVLQVTGTDIDAGDTLTFDLENRPEWASALMEDPDNPNTYLLTSRRPLAQEDVGTFENVVLSVDDGSVRISKAITIIVEDVNDAPEFSQTFLDTLPNIPDIKEGAAYTLTPGATDPDPDDVLIYSAYVTLAEGEESQYTTDGPSAGWPSWLSFDPNSGILSIAQNATDDEHLGEYQVRFTVSDDVLSDETQPFTLNIINVNDPPKLSGNVEPKVLKAETETGQGEVFTFTPTVSDPDSPAADLKYYVSKHPQWMTYLQDQPSVGSITFVNRKGRPTTATPPEQEGDQVTFSVNDNDDKNPLGDSMSFTVRVVDELNIPMGDFNGDGISDLSDAILGLQILAGIPSDGYIWLSKADTNADNVFGIQDVIYILKDMAAQ